MSERIPFENIKEEVAEDKDYLQLIQEELEKTPTTVIVLDDDPTGTQTVHDIPVVTNWENHTLEAEIAQSKVFYILTNSRSLTEEEASQLNELIGKRLADLAEKHERRLLVISREIPHFEVTIPKRF